MKISHFLVLNAIASLFLCACNSGKTDNKSENVDSSDVAVATKANLFGKVSDTTKSGVEVRQQLYDLYSNVMKGYSSDDSGLMEKLYRNAQSTSLNQLIAMADKKSDKVEDSWIDFDYWIDAQDYDNPMVVEASITSCTDTTANGYVLVDIFGGKQAEEPRKIGVEMVKENGKWLIDNLIIGCPTDSEVFDLRESINDWMKE